MQNERTWAFTDIGASEWFKVLDRLRYIEAQNQRLFNIVTQQQAVINNLQLQQKNRVETVFGTRPRQV